MRGGGRNAYAYRDLDEELFYPRYEADYHCQQSPPYPLGRASLSESKILRNHLAKSQSFRRKLILLAGSLLLIGIMLMIPVLQSIGHYEPSSLELTISAPYTALRSRSKMVKNGSPGNTKDKEPDAVNLVVGDFDPNDRQERWELDQEDDADDRELFLPNDQADNQDSKNMD